MLAHFEHGSFLHVFYWISRFKHQQTFYTKQDCYSFDCMETCNKHTHTHTQWMRRGPHYLWFYYRLNFRVEYTVCCVFIFFLFFDTFCCVHPISNVCGCGGAAPSRRLKRFARTLLNCSAKRMLAFISKWIQRTNIENLTMKMSQIRACTELMFLLWLKNELLHGFSWNARYTFTIYTKCIFSVCVCACDSCWNRAHKQSTRTAESQR